MVRSMNVLSIIVAAHNSFVYRGDWAQKIRVEMRPAGYRLNCGWLGVTFLCDLREFCGGKPMVKFRLGIGCVVCLFVAGVVVSAAWGQEAPRTVPGPPAGQLPPGISPGPNVLPKAGVCPLPILPAIPKYEDTAYYANADV